MLFAVPGVLSARYGRMTTPGLWRVRRCVLRGSANSIFRHSVPDTATLRYTAHKDSCIYNSHCGQSVSHKHRKAHVQADARSYMFDTVHKVCWTHSCRIYIQCSNMRSHWTKCVSNTRAMSSKPCLHQKLTMLSYQSLTWI